MPRFLNSFSLPIDMEEKLIRDRAEVNGGGFPYIDNVYPCCIFGKKELYNLSFGRITVLYGGNGSGKSTLLNLISEKLCLKRLAPFNSGELFGSYVKECNYCLGEDDEGEVLNIPEGSRIITSDDVFDYMLAARANNEKIAEDIEEGRREYARIKFGENVRLQGMEDYEALRLQVLSRSKSVSRRKFLRREVGEQTALQSNGETAIEYFKKMIDDDTLCCLDEPENSMSPKMQLELKKLLEDAVRYCGCQLIIATHSPFLLAMKGAKIYDLDSCPVAEKNWWELENTRIYYEFFSKYRALFENEGKRH